MSQTRLARNLSLNDLRRKFGLQRTEDAQFFREWQTTLPEITDKEQQLLDQVKAGYFNLLAYPPVLEDTVKLAILSPLLLLAGFYLPPFHIQSETSLEITAEDEGEKIQGKIDILVLKDQLWVLVIEAKQTVFSVEAGLAQILTYMLANPDPEQPSYGMITTGGNFIFLKLVPGKPSQYALSDPFSLLRQGNDLYTVLKILKRCGQILLSNETFD